MILYGITSKVIILMILVSSRQINTNPRKCFWDFMKEAVNEWEGKIEETTPGHSETTPGYSETEKLPEAWVVKEDPQKEIEIQDKQSHISEASVNTPTSPPVKEDELPPKYDSKTPDDSRYTSINWATNYFGLNFTIELNYNDSTIASIFNSSLERYFYLVFQQYFVAIVIFIVLAILLYFYVMLKKILKKFEDLENFKNQREVSEHCLIEVKKNAEEEDNFPVEEIEKLLVSSIWTVDKVFNYLKQMASESEEISAEDKANYITDTFLRKISNYICDQENLLEILKNVTPKGLVDFGRYNHHLTSLHEVGKNELKVNVGVYLNGTFLAGEKKDD